jgi:hypothetical protein
VLKWLVALLVIGGLAEWLAKNVSPTAGYSLVAIVVLGYASTGGNVDKINAFFGNVLGSGASSGGGK